MFVQAFNSAQNHINVALDWFQRQLSDPNADHTECLAETKMRINSQLRQLKQYINQD